MSIRCRLGYHAPVRTSPTRHPMRFGYSMTNAVCRRCDKRSWENWPGQCVDGVYACEPSLEIPALTLRQLERIARGMDCTVGAALDHALALFFEGLTTADPQGSAPDSASNASSQSPA